MATRVAVEPTHGPWQGASPAMSSSTPPRSTPSPADDAAPRTAPPRSAAASYAPWVRTAVDAVLVARARGGRRA
jgi:hypothetical protein